MAKYKAQPEYTVTIGENFSVEFDKFGFYETSEKDEIKALDALVPRYIKKVDDGKAKESKESEQPKEPESTEPEPEQPKPEPETPSKPAQEQRKKSGAKTPTSDK